MNDVLHIILHFIDKNEIRMAGFYHHIDSINFYTTIHSIYSVGANTEINWYFNGVMIEPSSLGSHYYLQEDGINSILTIKGTSKDLYGTYLVRIEGTNLFDDMYFKLGMQSIQLTAI